MDTSVNNQFFKCDSCNFSANRIKSGQNNRFRCVVNDQIHTCQSFNGSDVSSFTTDDSAFHFITRKGYYGNRAFGNMVCGTSLNCVRYDVFCFLVCLFFRFAFDVLNHDGGFVSYFFLCVCKKDCLRLFNRIARNPLKFFHLFGNNSVKVFLPVYQ